MQKESFKLKKRFRHQEEYVRLYSQTSWTKAILNVEGGTVLGRTPLRWLFLVIFYGIFFGSIALLFYTCYVVFSTTLTESMPKWTLQQPGISFEPSITKTHMNIEYYEHLEDEIDIYLDRITESLRKYGNVTKQQIILFTKLEDFGYKIRNPCIFLKINRMIGFNTEPIEHAKDLPPEAPNELREYLNKLSEEKRQNRIWISCESNPSIEFKYRRRSVKTKYVDNPSMVFHKDVSVESINEYGYENTYFYGRSDFYRMIAIRLVNVLPNVRYHVRCYAWAKNIVRDEEGKNGRGMVRFQLMIKA